MNRKILPCFFFLLYFFCINNSFKLFSQEPGKQSYILGFNAHYGFIASNHGSVDYLVQGHIPGFEINLATLSNGRKQWQQVYHYPEIGITFFHADLGNPSQLGYANAVYPYINFPLGDKNSFHLNVKAGVGMAYINKKFDRLNNYKNNVIGTHYNCIINLRLNSCIPISERSCIDMGIGLTHFSNGSYQMPNLGINIPSLNLGYAYRIGKKEEKHIRDSIPPVKKLLEYFIVVAQGLAEIEPPGGSKYTAYTLSGNVRKTLNYKSRIGIGMDIFYNNANAEYMFRQNIPVSKLQNTQCGIKLFYELTISKLSLPVEMGIYAFSKYLSDGFFYHRIGIRYQVSEHLIANFTLKTYWAKADHLEWGLGYKF